jgi:hypothetical protein
MAFDEKFSVIRPRSLSNSVSSVFSVVKSFAYALW